MWFFDLVRGNWDKYGVDLQAFSNVSSVYILLGKKCVF